MSVTFGDDGTAPPPKVRATIGNSGVMSLDMVPNFKKGQEPWNDKLCVHLNKTKWEGILVRCRHVDKIDQEMYFDLMKELVYQVAVRRKALDSGPEEPQEAPVALEGEPVVVTPQKIYEVPPAVLSVALLKALVGKQLNGDNAVELMSVVEQVVAAVNEGLAA